MCVSVSECVCEWGGRGIGLFVVFLVHKLILSTPLLYHSFVLFHIPKAFENKEMVTFTLFLQNYRNKLISSVGLLDH